MKRILALVLVLCLCFCFTPIAFADTGYVAETAYGNSNDTIEPRVEETKWYYKIVDGELYMRLWSITEGVWLTDWLPAN